MNSQLWFSGRGNLGNYWKPAQLKLKSLATFPHAMSQICSLTHENIFEWSLLLTLILLHSLYPFIIPFNSLPYSLTQHSSHLLELSSSLSQSLYSSTYSLSCSLTHKPVFSLTSIVFFTLSIPLFFRIFTSMLTHSWTFVKAHCFSLSLNCLLHSLNPFILPLIHFHSHSLINMFKSLLLLTWIVFKASSLSQSLYFYIQFQSMPSLMNVFSLKLTVFFSLSQSLYSSTSSLPRSLTHTCLKGSCLTLSIPSFFHVIPFHAHSLMTCLKACCFSLELFSSLSQSLYSSTWLPCSLTHKHS